MTEHTPTSWIIDGPTGYADHPGCMIYAPDGNGHLVAEFPPRCSDNQAANASFVVKCVNNHDKLVSALRSLVGERLPSREDFEQASAVLSEAK